MAIKQYTLSPTISFVLHIIQRAHTLVRVSILHSLLITNLVEYKIQYLSIKIYLIMYSTLKSRFVFGRIICPALWMLVTLSRGCGGRRAAYGRSKGKVGTSSGGKRGDNWWRWGT